METSEHTMLARIKVMDIRSNTFKRSYKISLRPRMLCLALWLCQKVPKLDFQSEFSMSKSSKSFYKQNGFLTCSWRFLRSNKLEQLEFKFEKNIGNQKPAGKVRKYIFKKEKIANAKKTSDHFLNNSHFIKVQIKVGSHDDH